MATTTSVQRNLTQLTVKGSSMTAGQIETAVGEAADAIADAMAAPTDSIGNTLTLWDVNLTPVVAEELVRLIRTSQTWDSVSLRNCSGDSRLCDDLYLACTTHRSLKSLEIQHAFDHPWRPTPTATIQAFAYGIRYNARLESLDLEGLRLDASMANLLSRALVRNTTLRKLGLEETFFVGTTATSAVVEATVTATADRNDENGSNNNNNNKNGAVQILSFGLRFNRTIESLALDRCKPLGDEDLACLINAVNSNGTVLRCLSLQGTPCHSESMQAVALLLQENVIEDLDMSYLERKRKKDNDDDKKDKTNNDTTDDDDDDDEPETKTKGENDDDDENENENDEADESKTSNNNNNNESESGASDTQPDESKPGEADNTAAADDSDPDDGNNEPEEDSQRIENTSLKRLAMVGNGLNDDYLASLLGIFAPPRQRQQPRQRRNNNNNNNNNNDNNKRRTVVAQNPSRLEELSLYGNRFSNHGVKELLKLLPRFPYLQRLYLGFQQQPPPALLLPLSLQNANHPSLEDRTTRFQPGLLDTEFVTAVADNPCNFRLTDVHIVTETARDEALKKILTYHTNLNDGGRRILAPSAALSSAANDDDDDDDDDDGPRDSAFATATTKTVPLGLWSLVLDRANRLYPLPSSSCPEMSEIEIETKTKDDVDFHAGDVIYCLLHGPMVFDNLDNNE